MWWNGQPWLNDESLWPVSDKPEKETPVSVHITQGEDQRVTPAGIYPDRFSSFGKLIRVTAYIQKFIKRLQKIPVENELQRAETQWLGYVKQHRYGEEIQALNHSKSTDLGNKLGFFIDNMGLIRCERRLEKAPMDDEMKYPILISGKDRLSELIIMDYHRKLLHAGNHTLNEFRKRMWVTRRRESVKNVLKKCLVCKRYEGGPFRMHKLAPLPKERLTKSYPLLTLDWTAVDP